MPRAWRRRSHARGSRSTGSRPRAPSHWNPTTSQLYTHALERHEGRLAEGGPLAVDTGKHTGRSPKDKFVVREPGSEDRIWWGDVNAEISEEHFEGLREKVVAHLGDARPLRRRRLRRRRPEAADRRPRRHELPVPRALRADDVHRPDRGGAARLRAAGARPARAGARGRSRGGRDAHGHVRRAAPVAPGGADRRHASTRARSRSRSSR